MREHNDVSGRLRRYVEETTNGWLTLKISKRSKHGVADSWASEKPVYAPGGDTASQFAKNMTSPAMGVHGTDGLGTFDSNIA